MRFLPVLTAFILLGSIPTPGALAFGSRDIPIDFAQRGVDVKVTPEGCSIDFGSESIAAVTISDRREILVRKMGASSVYLQRIQRQNIEGMMGMQDGTAVLRVWTTSGKRLSFRLTLGNGGGKDISIVPAATNYAARPTRPAIVQPISSLPKVYKPIPPVPSPVSTVAPAPIGLMRSSNPYPLLAPIPVSFKQPPVVVTQPQKPEKQNKKGSEELSKKADGKPIDSLALAASTPSETSSIPFSEAKPPIPFLQDKSQSEPDGQVKPQIKVTAIQKLQYSPSLNQAQAGAILKGLNIARLKQGKEKIAFLSPTWNKTQGVIRLLKRGRSLDDAINKTNSNRTLIIRLRKEGGFAD